jgi:inosine-uridine nucleoside N-ribohydrolase
MRRTIAILGISALLLGACSSGGPQDDRTPVVVDTDMGQDDMMALLYLLQRPDLRVGAIAVSGTGLAHCGPGVRIALSLLEVAGAPEDVPVSCGPEEPLPGEYPYPGTFPTSWRNATDDAYGIELPGTDRQPFDAPAPELIRAAIRDAGAPVQLLTLGPLTNVALALREDPAIVEDLAGITIMGGAVEVPGNVFRNEVAEFNIWVDPVAAEEVLRSGAAITLVPLDATNQAPVTPFFADALAQHHLTPEADIVHALFEAQPNLVQGESFFWDPLSAVILADPAVGTMEERRLKVLEGEKETQGQTAEAPEGAPVRVVVGADALAFERGFLNTLNGDDVIESTRPEPVATITFDDAGCAYNGPTSLPAELVAVSLDNPTETPWGVALVSIGEGHTYAELENLLEGLPPPDEPPPWVELVSIDEGAPGTKTLAAWPLEPGPYGVICASDDGSTIRAVVELVSG